MSNVDSPPGIRLTPSPRVICQIQRTDAARLRREVQTGAATGTLPPRWSVVGRVRKWTRSGWREHERRNHCCRVGGNWPGRTIDRPVRLAADRLGEVRGAAAGRYQAFGRPGRAPRIRPRQAGGPSGRPAGIHHRPGRQLECRGSADYPERRLVDGEQRQAKALTH